MKIILLTQNEPFFLAQNLARFLDRLPAEHTVAACVVLAPSPFGQKKSMPRKAWETLQIFGLRFFLHYAFHYVRARLDPRRQVLRVLQARGIPVLSPKGSVNAPDFLDQLRALQPDLLISIAGNQIFKRPLIDLAPKGCLNLHTALLPKYRGLFPSFWVLRNGEAETGVSVFMVDEGIDSGPILVQKRVAIQGMSQQDLIRHTKALGMEALLEAVQLIHQGGYTLQPNEDQAMTYYRFPTRQDVRAFRAQGARFF